MTSFFDVFFNAKTLREINSAIPAATAKTARMGIVDERIFISDGIRINLCLNSSETGISDFFSVLERI